MLEDQVAFLLQKYLGNYVRGLNKEALKISVWRGDVELTNMQLKPEALNELKLPIKVKAGFLGSVRLKVPWSRLGQEPVIVYLDRIFLLAEPATHVEGLSEDAVQDAKKTRIREMEMRLLESKQQLKSEMNTSWLGSLINTIIGNLKLSITNIHIRYEDLESNPGHPFAVGVTLDKLSAVTIDDSGKETFVTDGALDRIQKSVELERLALYFDSNIHPWEVDKAWEHLLPSEWSQVFEFDNKKGRTVVSTTDEHSYILQPVTGNAQYSKLRTDESKSADQPLQKALVNLDDVTLCLSKDGYRDILKLADNFAAFNLRLKYAHHRPSVSVKLNHRAWWKYAYKAVSDQIKKASGKLSWEQVLKYATLRKRYISLYASLLKSDVSRMIVDNNKDIEELDRGLDIEVILQWRMLAHKFVEQSMASELYLSKQKPKGSWWSFGWTGSSAKDENEPSYFNDEDWERLNKMIGYKEDLDEQALEVPEEGNFVHTLLEVHMKHNASKLVSDQKCLAELSCEDLDCSVKLHSVAKVFGLKLGSYQLSSPNGLVAKSATASNSLVGVFTYKPFDVNVDWSLIAKASPCYITYLKDSIDQIVKFFESSASVSQTIALETVAAVQMTIDGVKRSAQQQVSRALKDHSRFFLDLDIAAPKITVPTSFCPDNSHSTKLLLDFGNFVLRTQDDCDEVSSLEKGMYVQFNLCLSDVSAFLVDGDYCWSQPPDMSPNSAPSNCKTFLPVIDKCGMVLKLQQIRSESPTLPSTRLAIRLPSLGFHFSPSRYHRLMEVAKIFQNEDSDNSDLFCPWNQSDFEGWLYVLVRKGIGNREAAWQRRYCCLVGPFLYVLESPGSKTYKQSLSLRGKQIYVLTVESFGDVEHVLAISDAGQLNNKVLEDLNALILRCDSDDSKKTWQSRFQGAIYRTLDSVPITSLSETSSDSGDGEGEFVGSDKDDLLTVEKMFITGVLDELKICFFYTHWSDQGFMALLLCEESQLFEFRAKGGQVELSLQRNDLLIGMLLKSLEIEDLVAYDGMPRPRYLARSFIKSTDMHTLDSSLSRGHTRFESHVSCEVSQSEGDEKFFEASEDLTDDVDSMQPLENVLENLLIKPPRFSRMSGLLPDSDLNARAVDVGLADSLDSFVKAQIIIYDQSSPLYNNIDKQVMVALATLSFYCYRPTILAIMEFVNAINVDDQSRSSASNKSTAPVDLNDRNVEDSVDDQFSSPIPEPVVKSLLGKGKSRTIFYLTLSMARAQIFLMNENGTSFATLSQNNLLTDIKVFPSSFSIKADLGNLKISDDSLTSDHSYFWVCDMRNPGGNSFVELVFTSFSSVDEDYNGYDFSLLGRLSEVRIIYLNRFVQEVISYFMGLVPNDSKGVVKLKDQATNSEKWFTTSEIEGSPAVKLDLSLRKPIIVMPRRTDSHDYLELDVVHITVQNNFQWLFGDKGEMSAIHMERLTVQVEDINLTVGTDIRTGESIIQDVRGLSVVIQRSLRDLLHQIPTMEAAIKIQELKAALSNREYQIITECALSNISETPKSVPLLNLHHLTSNKLAEPADVQHEHHNSEAWITLAVSVSVDLVGLSLYSGVTRDTALATVQASSAWLLYKSNSLDEGSLLATLEGFIVVDDREGTKDEYRLAIGKPETLGYDILQGGWSRRAEHTSHIYTDKKILKDQDVNPFPTMLILDAKLNQLSTSVSLCIQRPQLLVALDFLLALAEFFVPTVRGMLSNEKDENLLNIVDAIVLDQPTYSQPSSDFSLSPKRPLIVDDERFGCFTYDGKGGNLYLLNSEGSNLCSPTTEAIIYVGNGKRLQFKNVHIKNGRFLDSSIILGTNSSYSVSKEDLVYLEDGYDDLCQNSSDVRANSLSTPATATNRSTEFIIELQAIGPELTFYNTSKDFGESAVLSNKLLHVQLDVLCRFVLKGETMEMSTNALGLTMESNGIKILEPFDASISFSSSSGKTNIHVAASDIFMNFPFSILRLFLAVENDIMAFLNMSSKKATVVCSQFDKVGTVQSPHNNQTYAFWRPRAPPGFAVLGDYLTPTNKPPTKGVLAVNTNFARVKKPVSFKLIWSSLHADSLDSNDHISDVEVENADSSLQDGSCSIWLPVAPQGYVALGCVVSFDRTEPPPSSTLCILSSLVSSCELRDCVTISLSEQYASRLAFWRVNNSIGSFLPADPISLSLIGRPYELRHVIFGCLDRPSKASKSSERQNVAQGGNQTLQSGRSSMANSGRRFEAIASFKLVWWNQGSSSRKKLSIWRPLVPEGMVFLGDIAVQGYEPPNTCIVLHDSGDGDEAFFRSPLDFQLVGQIKKHRTIESISFWFPQSPPGFVSLGCIACKGTPKPDDVKSLRCIRSDMVTGDQFSEESIWDTSDVRFLREPFSIWKVGDEAGTFLVRHGFRKPPKRFALKLADPNVSTGSDDTAIDAVVGSFSAALFDDYGGLMVPLFNVSLDGIGFSLHGRTDCLNSTLNLSLAARSYNDKFESWEPLIEPVDGFLRYQYDGSAAVSASQLRITSTRDLNLNVSVSNTNMILQAYASWNSLSHVHETNKRRQDISPNHEGKAVISIHHKKNSYIIMQNKLGMDIYLRASEMRGLAAVKMSHGDKETLKVPMSKNMLDTHLKGNYTEKLRTMVTIIILDGQLLLPGVDGLLNQQYVVAVRLVPNEDIPSESLLKQQSARTCGSSADHSFPDETELVNWNEMFFFKVDSPEYYRIEMIMTDLGKGEPVGFYSSPLNQIARESGPNDFSNDLAWIELSSTTSQNTPQEEKQKRLCGKIRCAMFLSRLYAAENDGQTMSEDMKSGVIQISPARKGPWSTVKLSYAAPVACWRFGNDVIASEVSVKDENRCVNIRSLVSITNSTDFILDLCLEPKNSLGDIKSVSDGHKQEENENDRDIVMDELFETEKYNPVSGWVGCSCQLNQDYREGTGFYEELSLSELPLGWEWVDDWHVDSSTNTADGWVYAPDLEHLKWPESYNQLKFVNYARQRRWIRSRKKIPGTSKQKISVGFLEPGATTSLPLSGLRSPYVLQLRPWNDCGQNEYSWSSVVDNQEPFESIGKPKEIPEICVSALTRSEELLHCSISDSSASSSSDRSVHGLWFSLSIQSTEIGKDIHSDPIQDWNLVIKAPLSIANFLPLPAEFSVLEKQASGEFVSCSEGVFFPGKTVKIYADLRHPLYFSLIPQGGWLPIHKAVLLYHPSRVSSKTIGLRSLLSERTVQVILEQNQDKAQRLLARVVRVYAPYWITSARCPPLTCRLVEFGRKASFPLSFPSRQRSEVLVEEITESELLEGYTIDSTLNFKLMGMSISIDKSNKKFYGPFQDLSPLGDMDGSVDLYAYDEDGKCMHLFISSKPCSFQSVPTKVISIRPFMTFTNRIGQDIFIKLNSEDEAKILRAFDSRVSFVYRKTEGSELSDKLQVRLEDTDWCIPVDITEEDTFSLVLRRNNGDRRFLRTEIRGNEEGSRFIVVFRLGSMDELMRIENRTVSKTISIRQSDLGDDAWIHLNPLSTINFSWDDPYGQRLIDARIHGENRLLLQKLDLTKPGGPTEETTPAVQFHVVEVGDLVVARFSENGSSGSSTIEDNKVLASIGSWGTSGMASKMQNNAVPIELIVELGIVGVSIIDQRPRELLYFYLEKVFISYSTGYSGGSTSRFKLILGNLQLDNQLPLTMTPVLLAPEQAADMHHPVFKMTVTMNNESVDGTQIYPYVYIRVTDKTWRFNIHEPIIWALVDFYSKLQLDRIPKSTTTSGIDPEIRVDLIDVSEVRLKLSLETEPTERPHGVLGVWSPVLSAVGNALKIQVHLRKVIRKNIFMRQSSVMPSIVNRFWRDLIHNPLHLIFSVDVLGMTSSTLASLSKGFAELSTDGQFLQLRSKQVWSRRITGVGDGVIQGTEALAQGVAFGVSGMVTKPVESARQYGLLGIAQGLGRAFLGFIVQPVSGALDFFSLTVDGIGASCSKCLEIFNYKATSQRIRNPRAIHADGVLREYCEREAIGQMVLYLAEASRHFGCTEIFKEPSKYAWSDHYEDHFMLPHQRVFLLTNKRVMLLQGMSLDKMEKKPSKIIWDVPWEELLALELAKAGYPRPSHLILHLKDFKKSEKFVRIIKCLVEEFDEEPQAVRICSVVHKLWKAYQADMRLVELKVPSSQRYVYFTEEEMGRRDPYNRTKLIIRPRDFSSVSSTSEERRLTKHTINFQKIWSSEREPTGRCKLCRKQVLDDGGICSIWRPTCLDGYVSVGDIAHVGTHPPTVAALYHYADGSFALPVGYDLVWRNCADDYVNPVSIWYPRAPDGFVSLGCVAVAGFKQPEYDSVHCVATSLAQEAAFEEQKVWAAPDSYPWACHIYQVQSEALHCIALRQQKEDSDWKPMRVVDDHHDVRHQKEDEL